jgi:hypothetical protein
MKHCIIFLLIVTGMHTLSLSQIVQNNIDAAGKYNPVLSFNGDIINSIKPDNTEGTPLLFDEWMQGYVIFRNKRIVKDVPLQFNLSNNTIYFLKEGNRYQVIDKVAEFSLLEKKGETAIKYLFRNTYPRYSSFSPDLFYEVVAEGAKAHFLKLCSKKITTSFVFNAPAVNAYHYQEQWFLYITETGSMIPVSGKKSVLNALPLLKDEINSLCEKNSWALKTAEQIAALVKELK